MCGRLVQSFAENDLEDLLGPLTGPTIPIRYNLAPGQPLAIVREQGGHRMLALVRWGLIPSSARDPGVASKLINARAETLEERGAFREAFRRRRCIVPASGFYEWEKLGKQRQPLYYRGLNDEPLALAGLWESWRNPGGETVETATIVTVAANDLIAPVHDRMPAILRGEAIAAWLDPRASEGASLKALLVPLAGGALAVRPVSSRVNSPKSDGPECIEPLVGGPAQQTLF